MQGRGKSGPAGANNDLDNGMLFFEILSSAAQKEKGFTDSTPSKIGCSRPRSGVMVMERDEDASFLTSVGAVEIEAGEYVSSITSIRVVEILGCWRWRSRRRSPLRPPPP